MITRVIKKQEILPDIHTVLLINKDQPIEGISLTKSELHYVTEQTRNNAKQIYLNTFYRWIFIQIIDYNNNEFQTYENIRRDAATMFDSHIKKEKIEELQIINKTSNSFFLLSFIEGLLLNQYQFDKYFSKQERKQYQIKNIYVIDETTQQSHLDEITNLSEAVYFTRDLINEPSNVLNSLSLASIAEQMAQQHHLYIKVYHKAEIEALQMGGLLAVNKGSVDPPVFIHIEYKPNNYINHQPIICVGKGITFDSGGLNLKPSDSMNGMKSDMSGGAAVLGLLKAATTNQIPIHLIGLIPATDNRPCFNAFAPGDVIRMMDGTYVEMLNSDAEGRMILADALHYAKQFNPQLVIDIATLTGSASAAVGRNATVAFAKTDENTYQKLEQAAFLSWERIVRFPLWDDYAEMLKSDIADIKNIGNRHAGAITAAKFLEYFTNYPWIHLDIAGPAFLDKKDSYRGVGGTAVGVRMLYYFLKQIQ